MTNIRGLKQLPEDACYCVMDSPVGELTLIASKQGLHGILWDTDYKDLKHSSIIETLTPSPDHAILVQTKQQLFDYFQGRRKSFNIPLVLNGTNFQIQAWNELRKIPYGQTLTYGQQAAKMGDKNKARAVGLANGQNPISIIIPCHRVIGSNGQLTGFAGGLDKKAYLLELER